MKKLNIYQKTAIISGLALLILGFVRVFALIPIYNLVGKSAETTNIDAVLDITSQRITVINTLIIIVAVVFVVSLMLGLSRKKNHDR